MLASESYFFLILVGIFAAVAVFAFLLGMTFVGKTKLKTGTILAQGLAHHVRFRYRSANGVSATLRAIIYEIEQRRGYLYFHGLCLPGRRPRTFRSDRVENLVDLESGEIAEDIDTWLRNLAAHA